MLIYFISVMCIPSGAVGLYLLQCEFHVIAPILTICPNWSDSESLLLVPVLAFVQFYYAAVLALSILPYIYIGVAVIAFGFYTVREMA
jgi:hypothetical protein